MNKFQKLDIRLKTDLSIKLMHICYALVIQQLLKESVASIKTHLHNLQVMHSIPGGILLLLENLKPEIARRDERGLHLNFL